MVMKSLYLFALVLSSNLLIVSAITKTRGADILNLNGIQDSGDGTERGRERDRIKDKGKDMAFTETQENRSFFKQDSDRRGGSFYPSGPPVGTSFGTTYHASGNGYSYGAPSGPPEYPQTYAIGYPSHPPSSSGPSHPPISSGPSLHSGYGVGLGGSYPVIPQGGGGHGHHSAMAIKGLLLPIAGVALLGAAAVLAKSNPVLLQLGVVSGKRKRRAMRDEYPVNPHVRPAV